MTTIELERKKAKLLEEIDSEELYDKVKKYISRLKKQELTLPNQYKTIEELYAGIEEAETELRNGGGYTTDQIKTKIKEWL